MSSIPKPVNTHYTWMPWGELAEVDYCVSTHPYIRKGHGFESHIRLEVK